MVDFWHLVTEKRQREWDKGIYFSQKMVGSGHILRKAKLRTPYLDNKFHQHIAGILNFLMSSLTCSQIWLTLLVDDSQPTDLTKLKSKESGVWELIPYVEGNWNRFHLLDLSVFTVLWSWDVIHPKIDSALGSWSWILEWQWEKLRISIERGSLHKLSMI